MRAAILGFGLSGRVFHLPLLRAAGIEVVSIAVRDPHRIEYSALHPELRFVDRDAVLADASIALVVVATPNARHSEDALAAIAAGKHVVVEKPLAIDIASARAVVKAAARSNRCVTVFHNRRRDGDFLTVLNLLNSGRLNDWAIFESIWGMNKPHSTNRWKDAEAQGGGLRIDFLPHLIDQVLHLFGTPDSVTLDSAYQRPATVGPDYLSVLMKYGERRVRLAVDCLAPTPRMRFRLAGPSGEYVCSGQDGQEAQLRQNLDVNAQAFGNADDTRISELSTFDRQIEPIHLLNGSYRSFYQELKIAIETGGEAPVSMQEAERVIAIMDALGKTGVWKL